MSNNVPVTKIVIGLVVIGVIGFFVGGLMTSNEPDSAITGTETAETRTTADGSSSAVDPVTPNGSEVAAADQMEDKMMDDDKMMEDDSMMDKAEGEATTDSAPVIAAAAGTYADYDPTLLANAGNGEVVLFFHAGWCPSCRGLEKDIESRLGDIPSGVTILKLNYDTETELKKKYGVVRQHTLVRVDADGNKIETLTGLTNTLDQVVAQL